MKKSMGKIRIVCCLCAVLFVLQIISCTSKEEVSDKRGIAMCLNNIGMILSRQGAYPKALEYYQRSLKICIGSEVFYKKEWSDHT